ncbi:MAG: DUF2948 family protein [Rubellimicrobium sp.]|nr:DUF2948 family protein [Rubellimicrobium sp.]
MTEDARFEDGAERPLRLRALDPDDLPVISALVQDAVFPVTEMRWLRRQRRFAILLNRFRWEDGDRRTPERVQSVISIEDVVKVQSQGIDRADKDVVLSLLSMSWEAGDEGAGRLVLTMAGDGEVAVSVEALEVLLRDVTRPYVAPSGQAPRHAD